MPYENIDNAGNEREKSVVERNPLLGAPCRNSWGKKGASSHNPEGRCRGGNHEAQLRELMYMKLYKKKFDKYTSLGNDTNSMDKEKV